jgi:hypothetical protein
MDCVDVDVDTAALSCRVVSILRCRCCDVDVVLTLVDCGSVVDADTVATMHRYCRCASILLLMLLLRCSHASQAMLVLLASILSRRYCGVNTVAFDGSIDTGV